MTSLLIDHVDLLQWRRDLAQLRAMLIEWRLLRAAVKANFNEDQPRDELGRWTLIGGTPAKTSDGFLTGIQEIDDTSEALSNVLAGVIRGVEHLPGMSPAMYGVAVHLAFGIALRIQDLPGVGDIERSFSLDTFDPRYGLAGTIRTDVTLRNVQGEIIAIYDVKTGDETISPTRARELRLKTRAAPDTPVFELNVVRGISRKHVLLRMVRPLVTVRYGGRL